MTEIKHTPGPWEYVPGTENHGPYVVNVVGNTVCDFYTMTNPTGPDGWSGGTPRPLNFCGEMAEDHARMVAAAPELLEACRHFVHKCDTGRARSTESYAQMKAAIAKAEGRT